MSDRRALEWERPVGPAHGSWRGGEPDPVTVSCASALGWTGLLLDRVRLFGQWVTVVAALDEAVHVARAASGWGPVLDRTTLACWEELPELWPEVPGPAVRMVGVLSCDTAWRRALTTAGSFIGFCATAFALDGPPVQECLLTAQWYGVAVLRLSDGSAELIQPGRSGRSPTSRPSAITRYAEERLYQRVLDDGLAPSGQSVP